MFKNTLFSVEIMKAFYIFIFRKEKNSDVGVTSQTESALHRHRLQFLQNGRVQAAHPGQEDALRDGCMSVSRV